MEKRMAKKTVGLPDRVQIGALMESMNRSLNILNESAQLEKRINDERHAQVLAGFGTINDRIERLSDERLLDRHANEKQFKRIDQRFGRIDEQFALIDERFDGMTKRFDGMDRRL